MNCDYEFLELSSGGFRPTVIASRRICPTPSLARPTLRRLAFTEVGLQFVETFCQRHPLTLSHGFETMGVQTPRFEILGSFVFGEAKTTPSEW